jgi:hypothetical protein
VLRLLTHASPGDIAGVSLDDVAPDGSEATVAGTVVAVPETARGILRTQRQLRLSEPTAPTNALLTYDNAKGGSPAATAEVVVRWLRDASRYTAVHATTTFTHRTRRDDKTWMRRRGLSIQWIGD